MLQALRDLATAKKEGLLTEEQYEKQHAALLAGEQRWGSSPTPDRLALFTYPARASTESLCCSGECPRSREQLQLADFPIACLAE